MPKTDRSFTAEEIRLLLEVEHRMDSGETPYIRVEGTSQRCAMEPELMKALGLQTGDRVTWAIFAATQRLKLESLEAELAYRRGQDLVKEVADAKD